MLIREVGRDTSETGRLTKAYCSSHGPWASEQKVWGPREPRNRKTQPRDGRKRFPQRENCRSAHQDDKQPMSKAWHRELALKKFSHHGVKGDRNEDGRKGDSAQPVSTTSRSELCRCVMAA